MIYYWRKYRRYIILSLTILLIICGIIYKNTVYETQVVRIDEQEPKQQNTEEVVVEKTTTALITVYVCGSVKTPSNVTLPEGSRVEDAVLLAGGLVDNADLNAVNMAQKLSDADMIYIPQKGEAAAAGVSLTGTAGIGTSKTKGKLNINKATAADLDGLPGIGPATAEKIIEYRSSKGSFKTVEELNNVSGIGDKKYDEIKALITVN